MWHGLFLMFMALVAIYSLTITLKELFPRMFNLLFKKEFDDQF
jgi:hypothetical protein